MTSKPPKPEAQERPKVEAQTQDAVHITTQKIDSRAFWEAHILPVQNQLSRSTYPVKGINDRMLTLAEAIKARHGRYMRVIAMGDYHPLSKNIFAKCSIENGEPVARLSISSLVDLWVDGRKKHERWEQEWELTLVVLLLHELEHLAHDSPTYGTEGFEELVSHEAYAWAQTCIYCLGPLFKEGYPIHADLKRNYDAWVRCGETINAGWNDYIRKKYSAFK